MKPFTFLLLCSLIIFINTKDCDDQETASSSKDCKDLTVTIPGSHCCYYKAKYEKSGTTTEDNECQEIPDAIYKKIKDYIKGLKKGAEVSGGKYKELKIDCNSSFLTISLFSLLLFLL
jgi:hypothetical protein